MGVDERGVKCPHSQIERPNSGIRAPNATVCTFYWHSKIDLNAYSTVVREYMSNQGIILEALRVEGRGKRLSDRECVLEIAQIRCDPTTCASGLGMVTRGNSAPPKVPMLYGEYMARAYAHTRRMEHKPRSDRAADIDSRTTEPYSTLRHSNLVSLAGSHATGWRLNIGQGGSTACDGRHK